MIPLPRKRYIIDAMLQELRHAGISSQKAFYEVCRIKNEMDAGAWGSSVAQYCLELMRSGAPISQWCYDLDSFGQGSSVDDRRAELRDCQDELRAQERWKPLFNDGVCLLRHPSLGLYLYHPFYQKSLPSNLVRLWSVDRRCRESHDKVDVRPQLRLVGSATTRAIDFAEAARAVASFQHCLRSKFTPEERQNRRTPWCWSCKHDLDSDFDLKCLSCGWLHCPCGACGCNRSRPS